jgi:uncharacterized membrane protein
MPRTRRPHPTTARTSPGPDRSGRPARRRDATGSASLLTLGVVALTAALLTGTARLGSAALEHQRAQAVADLAALAGAAAGPAGADRVTARNGASVVATAAGADGSFGVTVRVGAAVASAAAAPG